VIHSCLAHLNFTNKIAALSPVGIGLRHRLLFEYCKNVDVSTLNHFSRAKLQLQKPNVTHPINCPRNSMASPIVLFGDEHVVAQPAKLKTQQKFWSWLKDTGRGFEIRLDGDNSPLFTVETKHIGKLRTLKDKQGRTICTLNHSFFSSEDCWTAVRDNKTLLSVKYTWTPKECTIILEGLSDGKGVAPTLKVHRSSKWLGSFSIQQQDGQEVAKSRCINMAQSATSMLKVTPPTWEMDVPAGSDLVLVRHSAPQCYFLPCHD
jgi:hypothetical protein